MATQRRVERACAMGTSPAVELGDPASPRLLPELGKAPGAASGTFPAASTEGPAAAEVDEEEEGTAPARARAEAGSAGRAPSEGACGQPVAVTAHSPADIPAGCHRALCSDAQEFPKVPSSSCWTQHETVCGSNGTLPAACKVNSTVTESAVRPTKTKSEGVTELAKTPLDLSRELMQPSMIGLAQRRRQ
mmetsp:Transcript_102633/g.257248  ORF Transcript_102633/g.257248 Transcript_102633/m.257248 type:complete len:190 (+) Transcript_102633:2306-2875(+)